ncbi:L,D-transpeptidase [Allorhizobium sonneratiae]|uniref:L,D-transpeptidase n=1 Tax=Allorhizobium sonneratiae TaxID=2934936 RepID=UPI003B845D49
MPFVFRLMMLAVTGFGLSLLGGCLFVTDTGEMNTATFVQETTPVWDLPVAAPPPNAPPSTNLYSTTLHNTYDRLTYPARPASIDRTTTQSISARAPSPDADQADRPPTPFSVPAQAQLYASFVDDGHTLRAVPVGRVNWRFLRREVEYQTTESPGTIVVDTANHYLYFVERGGKAIRYGVGLGRQGYAWKGTGVIEAKVKWPRWTPTADMVSADPELREYSAANGGLNPGLQNPLGARAMYIYKNGRDTLYRIHGTNDWQSIGKAVSSGCVRMFNQDVIDLYNRVGKRTKVVVL